MLWISNVLLVTGILWIANIFGTISSLYQITTNFKEQKKDARLEMVNANMKALRVPEALQEEIREFMNLAQNSSENQNEMNQFIALLSPTLKAQVLNHIFNSSF